MTRNEKIERLNDQIVQMDKEIFALKARISDTYTLSALQEYAQRLVRVTGQMLQAERLRNSLYSLPE